MSKASALLKICGVGACFYSPGGGAVAGLVWVRGAWYRGASSLYCLQIGTDFLIKTIILLGRLFSRFC